MATNVGLTRKRLNAFRGNLNPMGVTRSIHSAEIPAGTELEALLAPAYFWAAGGRVQPLDTIECVWEDGTRVVVLRCMGRDDRASQFLFEVDSDKTYDLPAMPRGYDLEFVNKSAGWRVVDTGRKSALRGGFSTALEAARWLSADMDAAPEVTPKGNKKDKDKPDPKEPAAKETEKA